MTTTTKIIYLLYLYYLKTIPGSLAPNIPSSRFKPPETDPLSGLGLMANILSSEMKSKHHHPPNLLVVRYGSRAEPSSRTLVREQSSRAPRSRTQARILLERAEPTPCARSARAEQTFYAREFEPNRSHCSLGKIDLCSRAREADRYKIISNYVELRLRSEPIVSTTLMCIII